MLLELPEMDLPINSSNTRVLDFLGEEDIKKVKFHNLKTIYIWERLIDEFKKFSIIDQYEQLKNLIDGEQGEKLVCAKIIRNGDKIVECYDCRTDSTCIVCFDCYNDGNHEGHKVVIKKAYGGCCDCGDSEAWKPEGFCKRHSGEIKEIPIKEQVVKKFVGIMQDLYYVYIRLLLTGENHLRKTFFHALVNFVKEVNGWGLQYTKLLSLSFQSILPKDTHFINSLLNDRSLLGCMLTFNLMKEQILEWQGIFIAMFPYYEFKKLLVSAYIEYFGQLYTKSSKSAQYAQSIACQVINSYKLIEDYVANPSNNQLGYNLKYFGDNLENLTYALDSDFEKINKLVGDVPLKYWRFHILKGIDSFFLYYNHLHKKNAEEEEKEMPKTSKKKKKKKLEEDQKSEFSFIIRNSKFIQYEYQLIQTYAQILANIHTDKDLLVHLMKILYNFLIQDLEKPDLYIFKPYDRLFAMTLFEYSGQDISNLVHLREQIINHLNVSDRQFQQNLEKFKRRALDSYFFYSYILSHETRGYHTSFYFYLYFYKTKNRLMASVDLIYIKILILISRTPIYLCIDEVTRVEKDKESIWNLNHLLSFLEELGLLYISFSSQIYLSHFPKRSCPLYEKFIHNYLAKYLTEQGGFLEIERLRQFSKSFLIESQGDLKKYLKEICNYNKQKKIFQLKKEYQDQIGINFIDFFLRFRISNKQSSKKSPENTLNLIQGTINQKIFQQIWNLENVQQFCNILQKIYKDLKNQSQIRDNLIQFINAITKLYYLMSKCSVTGQTLEQLKQFIISVEVGPQIQKQLIKEYQQIVERETMKQQGNEIILKEKKELNRQKRLKKLQVLKKRASQNLSKVTQKYQMDVQPAIQEHSGNFCAICRKGQDASNFVYLGRLNFRNHERLLGMGNGTSCLSFISCYHIFDFECIQKSAIPKREFGFAFKCPVCRMVGNIFFVVHPSEEERSQKLIRECIDRILQVVITLRNYEQIDIVDELIKSIYHYVLMGLFDFGYVIKRRKKLYRIILEMLRGNKQLIQTNKRFEQGKVWLMPQMFKQKKRKKTTNLLLNALHQEMLDPIEQIDSGSEYEEYLQLMQQHVIQLTEQLRSKITRTFKKKAPQKARELQKMAPICRYVFERILSYLLPDRENLELEDFKPEVVAIINDLLGLNQIQVQSIGSLKLEMRELPKHYFWDTKLNICEFCNEMSSDLLICLLCPWKGCLNCPRGGVALHSKERHGELSAYMRQNDAIGYLIGEAQVRKEGCMYINEWGDEFGIKEDWELFELSQVVYQGLKRRLLTDQ